MVIDGNTKIGFILKNRPDALDAIIAISPKFEKLRNPLLRKLMAGRTSISMAAKIAGCSAADFFAALEPLGFKKGKAQEEAPAAKKEAPALLKNLKPEQLVVLDVRPVLEKGEDPLRQIQAAVKDLGPDQVLKIVNTFEPTPLITLLGKQGLQSYVVALEPDLIETYFFKDRPVNGQDPGLPEIKQGGWEKILLAYKGKMVEVDVRQMEMPMPMMTILEAIDNLPAEKALFVYHKRIPVFLLPELKQREFDYRIREISENEIRLLIFKN